jgi:NAD-dependent deacetylase
MSGAMPDSVDICARLIEEASSIAVLTGAGISTNAGIPDFRGPRGLYVTKQYDAGKIFDIQHFYTDPKPFYEFARDFFAVEATIKPTVTHRFLTSLEQTGKLKGIVTQNIDGLHYKAGSKNVYEMHGSFWQSACIECGAPFNFKELKERMAVDFVPKCRCGSVIKPDIVFFGENVKFYDEAARLAEASDLFFVIGSSCAVFPAALVPTLVQGKIVIINQGKVNLSLYNIVLDVQQDADQFLTQVARKLNLGV